MGQPWWIIVTCVNTLDFCNATDHYIVPRCGAGRCEVKTLNGCRDFRTYDMRKHLRHPSGMGMPSMQKTLPSRLQEQERV